MHTYLHSHPCTHIHEQTHTCSHDHTYTCTPARAHSPVAVTPRKAPPRRGAPRRTLLRPWTVTRTIFCAQPSITALRAGSPGATPRGCGPDRPGAHPSVAPHPCPEQMAPGGLGCGWASPRRT